MYKDITFKAIADQIQTEYIPNETAKNRDIILIEKLNQTHK